MKQVDTKAYMTALRSLTEQGHSVSVPGRRQQYVALSGRRA